MAQHRRVDTITALVVPVVGTMILSVGGLLGTRWLFARAGISLAGCNESVGNYLQTVGTIYAVLLAFVVFVVWTQFNDARAQIEREANELLDVVRTARGLPEEPRRELHRTAREYIDAVLGKEWEAMARRDTRVPEEVALLLERMWDALQRIEPASDGVRALHAEALARFNDLSDVRTNRLSSSQLKIPLALKILIYIGAFTVIGSMYLFHVGPLWIHALITAAMAGVLSHVLYVIADLDDPFSGDWQVPREPFERVRRYLDIHCNNS